MLIRLGRIAAVVATMLYATSALAWNERGHMIIAAIAYEKLDQGVKTRVDELLKLNPQHEAWTRGVSTKLAPEVAFVRAATWPDFIKSQPDYVRDGDRPSGPTSSQNIGYADKLQHRYWHYIDIPFSTDGTPLEEPEAPNAETQIEAFRATLASPDASEDVKSYDLVWLLHVVGDVHQPLHATSRFSVGLPHGDRGGNSVKVTCKPSCSALNLHAFWDGVLGAGNSAAAAIGAARKLAKQELPKATGTLVDWIHESEKAAESVVYAPPVGAGAGPYALSAGYQARARAVADERALLAGARLAVLLTAALQPVSSSR